MRNYVAYFLLLVLVVGLPVAVLSMPWSIDWAYWLQAKVMIGAAGWIIVSSALLWATLQLSKWLERMSSASAVEN
jgi:uncharacterized membrane protein